MPTRKIVIAREKKHSTPSSSPPLLIIGRVTEMEHGKNSWSLASSFISSVHNVPFTSYGGPFINSTPSVDPVPSPARIMHKRRQENGATKNPITRTCLCVYIFFFFEHAARSTTHQCKFMREVVALSRQAGHQLLWRPPDGERVCILAYMH